MSSDKSSQDDDTLHENSKLGGSDLGDTKQRTTVDKGGVGDESGVAATLILPRFHEPLRGVYSNALERCKTAVYISSYLSKDMRDSIVEQTNIVSGSKRED
ncbi:hypothetical protein KIN20_027802 [Parelaphostrongylus tenuis]|uniref:Uncharacterized protein n=1 Tax=Parelaphostrongylus tenuis TaxID=148309 RepID=A0AAD5R005_PARTN|nr:hypothetical protein KIN20_027802 [Parelaphostrongylus tenuis]